MLSRLVGTMRPTSRLLGVVRCIPSCTTSPSTPSSSSSSFVFSSPRFYSSGEQNSKEQQSPKDKAKIRRAYALGGCLMFIWLSTHGILLYRRRSEFRSLNEKLPPISWEEFNEKYLLTGQVKAIVYQPQFAVGNVYLHSATEQMMKKSILDTFHVAPDKFSRPPDVRFYYEGDQKEVEHLVLESQKALSDAGTEVKAVEFSVDQFPSYRELSFIIASTFFTLAAVTLMK